MIDNRLRRIHDVTDNFFFWQGLRWIPLGVALLGTAVTLSPGVPIPAPLRSWILLPFFGLALWLSSSVLGRYYARHFGRVRADPSRHALRMSVKWLVVYPAVILALLVDIKFRPPIVISGIAFALAIEAYRQSTGGGRGHYTIAAIGLLAFSLLPLLGALPPGKVALNALIGIVGLTYIVGGVLDHRELVRVLGPLRQGEHVSPV